MDAEINAANRDLLGVIHLRGQVVRPLGSEQVDSLACAEMYHRLDAEMLTQLEAPDPIYQAFYYEVGDRYLLYYGPMPPHYLLTSVVVVFDEQFREVGSAAW